MNIRPMLAIFEAYARGNYLARLDAHGRTNAMCIRVAVYRQGQFIGYSLQLW